MNLDGIHTSVDGVTWVPRRVPDLGFSGLIGVCYGNGQFVAVGGPGIIFTSTDGSELGLAPVGDDEHGLVPSRTAMASFVM